jgi:hypothetical protein
MANKKTEAKAQEQLWSGGSTVAPRFRGGNSTTPEHLRGTLTYC